MYVSVHIDHDKHLFAGEACCSPVDIDVTAKLDLSEGGNVMHVATFNASNNFSCDDVTLRRRRGQEIPDDLRAEVSEMVSRKVEAEVRGALESTYAAIFGDELRDTFPRLAELAPRGNTAAAALTSSGSSPERPL